MRIVRLYVVQDNRRWEEDIPYGPHLERVADLEIQGATVYHASLLSQAKPRTNRSRLKQRLY